MAFWNLIIQELHTADGGGQPDTVWGVCSWYTQSYTQWELKRLNGRVVIVSATALLII